MRPFSDLERPGEFLTAWIADSILRMANCTRVYYEELPYAKRKALTWGQFKKVAKLARIPGRLSKNAARQLAQKVSDDLNDYWSKK